MLINCPKLKPHKKNHNIRTAKLLSIDAGEKHVSTKLSQTIDSIIIHNNQPNVDPIKPCRRA